MRKDAVADYCMVNRELVPTAKASIFEQVGKDAIYEVIKVLDGIPLFFEAHMERMRHSADMLTDRISKRDSEILKEIRILIRRNRMDNINAKLVWARIQGLSYFLTYFIDAESPGAQAYEQGIHVILYKGEREQPNLKTLKGSFRDNVRLAREQSGAYEALLLDEGGFIAEGTRSNIFFIKNNIIYTPPAETVLLGITRHQILHICREAGLQVKEERLHIDNLKMLQAAFITGTTVDVLPIGSIEDVSIPSTTNSDLKRIIALYQERIQDYLQQHPAR